MSRPIYEPTLERADAALGYDKNQLQRRPSPTAADAVLEGVAIDWAWAEGGMSSPARDTEHLATFDTSGNGGGPFLDNHATLDYPRILKAGMYVFHAHINVEDAMAAAMPTWFKLKIGVTLDGATSFVLNALAPGNTSAGNANSAFMSVGETNPAGISGFQMDKWAAVAYTRDPPAPLNQFITFEYLGASDVDDVYYALAVFRVRDGSVYDGSGGIESELDYEIDGVASGFRVP